jgi:hypothetical protein
MKFFTALLLEVELVADVLSVLLVLSVDDVELLLEVSSEIPMLDRAAEMDDINPPSLSPSLGGGGGGGISAC